MAEQKKALRDLFGDDISSQARADLAKAGELAARELEEKVFGNRKSELRTLTIELEEAIRDVVWESEHGDAVSWMQAQQRRDEIRERIYQMIEEGV